MLSKKAAAESVNRYFELKAIRDAADAEMEAIASGFKKELDRRGTEVMEVGDKTVRWTSYVKNQFDSKGFRVACPDEYAAWTKAVESRRFSIT